MCMFCRESIIILLEYLQQLNSWACIFLLNVQQFAAASLDSEFLW